MKTIFFIQHFIFSTFTHVFIYLKGTHERFAVREKA